MVNHRFLDVHTHTNSTEHVFLPFAFLIVHRIAKFKFLNGFLPFCIHLHPKFGHQSGDGKATGEKVPIQLTILLIHPMPQTSNGFIVGAQRMGDLIDSRCHGVHPGKTLRPYSNIPTPPGVNRRRLEPRCRC